MAIPIKRTNYKTLNLSLKEYKFLKSFQYDKPNLRERKRISLKENSIDTNESCYERNRDIFFLQKKQKNKSNEFSNKKGNLITISLDGISFQEDEIQNSEIKNDISYQGDELICNKEDDLNIFSNNQKTESDILDKRSTNINDNNNSLLLINSKYLHENFPNEIDSFLKVKQQNLKLSQILKEHTFINCDLRYFNLNLITERLGYFDVVLIDPPWRLKGNQKKEGNLMFSNSRFKLDYNTLSNPDIMNIKVDSLSEKGFCFLWVLNSLLDVGYECLNKWGYKVVDQIIWVKQKNNNLFTSQGFYFLHSYEICLVGFKCPKGKNVNWSKRVSSNIIMAEIEKKSKKPNELYQIIEEMLPGSKKIELFARNHNLREGWFSIGNQLGSDYEHWINEIFCNNCNSKIEMGIKRYKSKLKSNYDICDKCYSLIFINKENVFNEHNYNDFFILNNNITDAIYHENFTCNYCKSDPIYGLRFHCKTCDNFDLCETCYDKKIESHTHNHNFICVELPEIANGFSSHFDCRCNICYMKPILGPCFECLDCKSVFFCQNCYFNARDDDFGHFGKESFHKVQLKIINDKVKIAKIVKCNGCGIDPIIDIRYKCNQCFEYNLCKECYRNKSKIDFIDSSHRQYHIFTCYEM